MKRIIPVFHIFFTIFCFGLFPNGFAIVPPPDGCYPGFTTAEGCNALKSLTAGIGNTGIGWYSLFANASGNFNTAVGGGALDLNTADNNTAIGAAALLLNTTGTNNTANGVDALALNDTGEENTATGAFALFSNTEGDFNAADGAFALYFNTTGERNTAIGDSALYSNTQGNRNTAIGNAALLNNDGSENTAVGAGALFSNNAFDNTAIGADALSANTSGDNNTAIGNGTLTSNISGNSNTAVGRGALNGSSTGFNTAVGDFALHENTTGGSNTALGRLAGSGVTTASNVICVGADVAGANVDNSCYVGNIWQQPGGSQAVYVNAEGKLGALVSSRRFKEDIKPIEQASEVIYGLKPVSFRYKAEIESVCSPSFGLIAEDVEKVSPDLVLRDKEGNAYTVRYDQVNAMLLNEFLKAHRRMEQQEATIAQLKANSATQQAVISDLKNRLETVVVRFEEQDSKIKRVNDRLALRQSDPQLTVMNP